MARQTPNERAEASQQRLNNRSHNIRSSITAREQRLGREIVDDLNDLLPPPPPPTLRKEEPRGGIPAARGYAEKNYQQGSGGGGGAGIASPITEPDFAAREYYATGLRSSDGLFFLPAVKKIVMQDAGGAPAVFEFAEPI